MFEEMNLGVLSLAQSLLIRETKTGLRHDHGAPELVKSGGGQF
jgi:hypothetical protein